MPSAPTGVSQISVIFNLFHIWAMRSFQRKCRHLQPCCKLKSLLRRKKKAKLYFLSTCDWRTGKTDFLATVFSALRSSISALQHLFDPVPWKALEVWAKAGDLFYPHNFNSIIAKSSVHDTGMKGDKYIYKCTNRSGKLLEKTGFAQYSDIPVSRFYSTTSNVLKTRCQNKSLLDLKPILYI